MTIKKGYIGVRTKENGTGYTVGTIHEAIGTSTYRDTHLCYKSGQSAHPDSFRPATEEEIKAYHLGCRHIDDLNQYINHETLLSTIL